MHKYINKLIKEPTFFLEQEGQLYWLAPGADMKEAEPIMWEKAYPLICPKCGSWIIGQRLKRF